jgi:hypothetical protein
MSLKSDSQSSDVILTLRRNLGTLNEISGKMLNDYSCKNNMLSGDMMNVNFKAHMNMTGGGSKGKKRYHPKSDSTKVSNFAERASDSTPVHETGSSSSDSDDSSDAETTNSSSDNDSDNDSVPSSEAISSSSHKRAKKRGYY